MANEATCVNESELNAVSMTVGNGSTITKGQILWLTDPRTVSGASTDASPFGGIAAADKEAADGDTEIGCYHDGIWDMLVHCGSITLGQPVMISGQNTISGTTLADTNGFGRALETGSQDERIEIQLRRP